MAHMGDKSIQVYPVLVVRPEGKRPFRRPRHRWENNIKKLFSRSSKGNYGLA